MIPDEAVTAAAKVIYADNISNHAGDNAPQIIDACERVARKILEAAAPHLTGPALSRNRLMDIIADAYGNENHGHLSVKAADAILAEWNV